MLRRSSLSAVFAALPLLACAHAPARTTTVLPVPPLSLAAAPALPATQTLDIAFGSREDTLQCALASEASGWQSVCVNALGLRVFTLAVSATGAITAERGPGVPEALDARRVLADVQLAHWPLAALEAAYAGSPWQVTEASADTRRQWLDGELVSEVHYAGEGAKARHWLVNLRQGYSLGITPGVP